MHIREREAACRLMEFDMECPPAFFGNGVNVLPGGVAAQAFDILRIREPFDFGKLLRRQAEQPGTVMLGHKQIARRIRGLQFVAANAGDRPFGHHFEAISGNDLVLAQHIVSQCEKALPFFIPHDAMRRIEAVGVQCFIRLFQ